MPKRICLCISRAVSRTPRRKTSASGELHVVVVAPNPNYTFDPEVFPESPESSAIESKTYPAARTETTRWAWLGLAWIGQGTASMAHRIQRKLAGPNHTVAFAWRTGTRNICCGLSLSVRRYMLWIKLCCEGRERMYCPSIWIVWFVSILPRNLADLRCM